MKDEVEKSPEGLSSSSLRLNTDSLANITDTLKDYALKLVANAHSEMSEEQWGGWLNEHTETYAQSLVKAQVEAVRAALEPIDKMTDKLGDDYGEFECLDDIEKYVAESLANLKEDGETE